MRADRLLSILLLLQQHSMLTVRELARRLEVSPRTIHRDMEALSTAGVPVLAERGANGGWRLLEPYRTDLTGLNAAELQALLVGSPAHVLGDLGLRSAYEAAIIKLQSAAPAALIDADFIRQRIHIDTPGWHAQREDQPHFRTLQTAVLTDRRVKMVYERSGGETVERIVDPLGLVAKGQVWYLAAAVTGVDAAETEIRTYRVSRVQAAALLDEACQRPAGFELAAYWADAAAAFVAGLPQYLVTLRVEQAHFERLRASWRFGRVREVSAPDAVGWCQVMLDFEVLEEATAYTLSLGPYAEVIAPEALRERVRDFAQRTAAVYIDTALAGAALGGSGALK